MGQPAVVLLAVFAQREHTYTVERTAHPPRRGHPHGRRVGRPTVGDLTSSAPAAHLRAIPIPIPISPIDR
jgi:hypothetical protein